MPAVTQVILPSIDPDGRPRGTLCVRLLPNTDATLNPKPLLDLRDDPYRDETTEPIQLLEGTEYSFEFQLDDSPAPRLSTDRPEVFQPDTADGRRGRLRPGTYTGTLPVTIFINGEQAGDLRFEVRSRKLDYLSHYRWMLRDIADAFAEVIMDRFAPSEQRFHTEHTRDAATLYQRFAFLKGLITDDLFTAALHQVLARPHRAWMVEEEQRSPGQGIPATSRSAHELATPGPRVPWSTNGQPMPLPFLPQTITVQRHEETLDTPENRVVKFAITQWRAVVARIRDMLSSQPLSPSTLRGRRETETLIRQLDELLAARIFTEVGDLVQFPGNSQVLHKRAGYREVFRAYLEFEAAATLTWAGGESVYGAGQKDVATLYEYWAFLQLASVISRLVQAPLDLARLLEQSEDGLNVSLRQGRQQVLVGSTTSLGRQIQVELWYNRTFARGQSGATAWTLPMRPDYSLRITPASAQSPPFGEVWLHFDAKYRVENLLEVFAGDLAAAEAPESAAQAPVAITAKRDDLLKMHAYRDAIRRSVGAYVLYPGSEARTYAQYHELLPGLGAFSLRPTETGDVQGATALEQFLVGVITHVASQVTQHERSRFWHQAAYDDRYRSDSLVPAAPFLDLPPADTLVLLGFVKSDAHREWIHKTLRYNLRAGERNGAVGLRSRELAVALVLLYGPGLPQPELWQVKDEPELITRSGMLALDYPEPGGDAYFCLALGEALDGAWTQHLSDESIERLRKLAKPDAPFGAPVVTTWFTLVTNNSD